MKLLIYSSKKTVSMSVSYALRMSASNGIIIRDDPLELKAEVVNLKTNEVLDFDDSYYEWRRVEEGWTPKNGKTIQITKDDIVGNAANFYAVFTHPSYSVFTLGNLQIRNIEGLQGADGWSRAILTLYKRSASVPSVFDGGQVSFTFSTNTLTGDIGSWSKTIPNGDEPLYVVYATAFANAETDAVDANEWTAPALLSENGTKGEDGMHVYSLTLYQRGTKAPSVPSGTVTYSFETKQVTNAGSWSIGIPTGTDPVWAIIATAASNTTGDTIDPSEWTEPVVVFEKGDKGDKGDKGEAGADSKLITVSADKTLFQLDSNGEPYAGQEIAVSVTKQNISDDVVIESSPFKAEGSEFKVVPQMMGLKPVEVHNEESKYELTSTYEYLGHYGNREAVDGKVRWYGESSGSYRHVFVYPQITSTDIKDDYVFVRFKLNSGTGVYGLYATGTYTYDGTIYNLNTNLAYSNIGTLSANTDFYYYTLVKLARPSSVDRYEFRFTPSIATTAGDNSALYIDIYPEYTIMGVDELLALPKLQAMTDAEKLEWLNTYIPTIAPNSTWTVGGRAKNLLPNPTSSDGWACGSAVTNFSASNGIVTGTTDKTFGTSGAYWTYKYFDSSFEIGDTLYAHIGDISATNGYIIAQGYWSFGTNNSSGIRQVINNASGYQRLVFSTATADVSSTVTIDTTKGINVLNLTESGWLAQLSLMGVEGTSKVKAWLDKYIPFFEGELAFPRFTEATIKASAGGYSDYLSILAYTQPRSLKLSATPSKFKLDADNVAQEDAITIKAHTQNIHEEISWSNDRNIPMVEGDVQTLYAYQMGVKPIEIKRLDIEYLSRYQCSYTSSDGVYTITGTSTNGFLYIAMDDARNEVSVPILQSNKWFARAKIKNLASVTANAYIHANGADAIARTTISLNTNEESYVYTLCYEFVSNSSQQFQFRCESSSGSINSSYELSEITIVPVTELLTHPKLASMTNAEKLEWLNTYIPTIAPNSTWTVGGKAKNISASSPEWSSRTVTLASGDRVGLASQEALFLDTVINGNTYYASSTQKYSYSEGTSVTFTANSYLQRALNYGTLWMAYREEIALEETKRVSGVGTPNTYGEYVTWLPSYFRVTDGLSVTAGATFTSYCKEEMAIDLTSSGWLAQLSLMGIEGDDNVKAWLDENVPFFVGEFDFPYYKDVTYTASYAELSDSITITAEPVVNSVPTYIKTIYNATDLVSVTRRPDNTPLVRGDYLLALAGGYHVPYTWDGSNWKVMDDTDPSYCNISNLLPTVLASDQTVPSTSAIWGFFDKLIANAAFIDRLTSEQAVITSLFSNYIKVLGAIYGGGFDSAGNIASGERGFHLSKDGRFQAVEAFLTNASVSGSFINKHFRTVSADTNISSLSYTMPTPTRVDVATLNQKIYSYWRSDLGNTTNFTYNGVTYTTLRGHIVKMIDPCIAWRKMRQSDVNEYGIPYSTSVMVVEYNSDAPSDSVFLPEGLSMNYLHSLDVYYYRIDRMPPAYKDKSLFSSSFYIGDTTLYISDFIYTPISTLPEITETFGDMIGFEGTITFKALDNNTYTYTSGYAKYSNEFLSIFNTDGELLIDVGCVRSLSIDVTLILGKNGIEVENIVPMGDEVSDIGTESVRFNNAYIKEVHADKVYGAVFN